MRTHTIKLALFSSLVKSGFLRPTHMSGIDVWCLITCGGSEDWPEPGTCVVVKRH